MFRKLGFVLLFAVLCGACSVRKESTAQMLANRQEADWEVLVHGVVEYVEDDYVVVNFHRVTIEGTPDTEPGFSEISFRPIVKVFKTLEPNWDGVGINYPIVFRPGDPAFLKFQGLLGVNPSWLAAHRSEYVRDHEQSALPALIGLRATQRQ